MRIFITIVILLFTHSISAQQPIKAKGQEVLRTELHRLINDLRISKGLEPLLRSDTLINAAQLQATYQAKKNEVTHDQNKASLATPFARVKVSKGVDFEAVGENCISAYSDYPARKKALIAVANDMFERWKKSPGHYANMVNPDYVFGDLAFSYNARTNLIYGTQVFGRRGTLIPGQLSENAFGILEGYTDCEQKYNGFQNIIANMGNALRVEGNEVVLYYHSLNRWDNIFTSPKDGLAADLVFREQFECGGPNTLDVSPVYDGIMLQPVYKNELFQNNRALSNYRLITPVGVIPDEYLGKDMQVSLIFIDNQKNCKYVVPAEVPSKAYALRPIDPFMDDPYGVTLDSSGIIASQKLTYDFERGNARPVKYPEFKKLQSPVHSVNITCYTSIEGDTLINNKLHTNRAKTIKSHLKRNVRFHDSLLTTTAEENWNEMNFQLQYFFADSLLTWPKDSIRQLAVMEDQPLPWDSLLFEQRESSAMIHYSGTLEDSVSQFEYLLLNLKTAIALENWQQANKALYAAHNDSTLTVFDKGTIMLDPYVQAAVKKHPQIVKNSAALMVHTLTSDVKPCTEFINIWLSRKDELSTEAQQNIIHLYTLTCLKLLDRWDVPDSRLANVIHPSKIKVLSTENLSEKLMLNLHLSFIQYYGQINDTPGIIASFDFISNYFREHSLNQEDDVDLCLFFNSWSRYDLTINYLNDKFNKKAINEDGVFLLLKTWYFYGDKDHTAYERVHEKAISLNQERYCRYIYNNFQTLRNTSIKNTYCKLCTN